ncbi:hypothetical protein HELRODRAFT_170223 [Helobdella robusta]|uniref:M-phase phosphoprotein 6 n=1 Tax=Helobdella robusta TaxID=6412 RepID=T1F2T1_HELRO|nr:hypothetical protein HELRODRAFT_170223 [Helobdella robusta]ESO07689.1 hypothetical protein HELRODRAFT_170223 [Helobdella robusta]
MSAKREKELTKEILLMKFMQKKCLKNDDEGMDTKYYNDEYWVLDKPDVPQKPIKYKYVASYSECAKLKFGRQSFNGFNKEIESINKNIELKLRDAEIDENEKLNMIDDIEMADRYSSLVHSLKNKTKTKRQRNCTNDSDTPLSKKPAFKRPPP